MLRSQAGVDEVERPYENLKQGMIQVKAKRDAPVDLAGLIRILEKQIGFEPLTQVRLELTGQVEKQQGRLVLVSSGTGQRFRVAPGEFKGRLPEEKALIRATAILKSPRAPDRIRLVEWKEVSRSQAAAP